MVRSHESIVLALAMDPHNREFTTTAADVHPELQTLNHLA